LSDGLINLGFTAGGDDDRCAFAGRGLGSCKSEPGSSADQYDAFRSRCGLVVDHPEIVFLACALIARKRHSVRISFFDFLKPFAIGLYIFACFAGPISEAKAGAFAWKAFRGADFEALPCTVHKF
jgi:hypothetical protein